MTPQWITDIFAVAPWIGGFFVVAFLAGRVWRFVGPTVKKVLNFLDDWNGEPARPGVPERLGVMARLDEMHHELHPNHGSSLADAVNRTEAALKEHIANCPPPQQTTINVNAPDARRNQE